jgi:predicted PurR-regulated permease PerM
MSKDAKPDAAIGVSPSGHNKLIGQPHSDNEGPIAEAETAAAGLISHEHPVGEPGRQFDRRSPFFIAVLATLGVAVTYGVIQLLVAGGQIFVLLAFSLFLAIGLEPAVSWLVTKGFKRGLAVASVLLGLVALIGGFIALAVQPLVAQVKQLGDDLPKLATQINDNSTVIGKLNEQLSLEENVRKLLSEGGSRLATGALGVGAAILSGVASVVLVMVLTAYLVADMPRIRRNMYRLFPASRRPRAILIGDQILVKVGAFVLGNLAISGITGVITFVWLIIFDVPYALLLAIFVALVDLIPVVGSTIGGIVVSLVALSVSLPVAIGTLIFYIVYQSIEGYVLVPPIIGKAVRVPAMVTAVAVVVGGAMLGLLGALVAIPVSAGLLLVLREVLYPRLDRI